MRKLLFLLILLLPASTLAQNEKKPSVWEPLKFFVGEWEGESKGQPGNSTVERSYQFVLNNRYLQTKNTSVYPPQEKNPKGEKHEDLGMFSYDSGRKKFVLRQFHIEGFVNQYILEKQPEDGKVWVFTSEAIENIPNGFRARETYKIISADEFVETFEIAEPGKDFQVYSEARFKRKRQSSTQPQKEK